MPKLTDTQTILLSHAAQHKDGSFIPLPEPLLGEAARERVAKAFAQLLTRTLAVERETSDFATVHRVDGDLNYGLFITPAGLQAIGVEDADAGGGEVAPAAAPSPASAPVPAPRQTKAATVLALLQREQGATVPELMAVTGWLPHTTRAALTGIRKQHVLEKTRRGLDSCYRVVAA